MPRTMVQRKSGFFSLGSSLELSEAPGKGVGSLIMGEDCKSFIHSTVFESEVVLKPFLGSGST